jgi:hypothetical protein
VTHQRRNLKIDIPGRGVRNEALGDAGVAQQLRPRRPREERHGVGDGHRAQLDADRRADGILLDVCVQCREQRRRQRLPAVDLVPVVRVRPQELVHVRAAILRNVRVVQARVEHDETHGQQVRDVRSGKQRALAARLVNGGAEGLKTVAASQTSTAPSHTNAGDATQTRVVAHSDNASQTHSHAIDLLALSGQVK